MADRDLTPQLRTRMRGVERAVGLFVFVAFLLSLSGFAYYIHHTAERKGWFLPKVRCHTFLKNAGGLKVGDPVTMFGFPAGEIISVEAMPPFSELGNVYVEFIVQGANIGYVWSDSKVRVSTADFLGKRTFELIPGGTSGTSKLHASFQLDKKGRPLKVWTQNHWYAPGGEGKYVDYTHDSKGYTLFPDESPALGERLDRVASKIELGLPGIISMTNQIHSAVARWEALSQKLEAAAGATLPSLTHLETITRQLTNHQGSLGEWLMTTNLQSEVLRTFTHANEAIADARRAMTNADSEIQSLGASMLVSLEHLAGITSNLNSQVQRNTNLLSEVTSAVRHTDELIQGLKKHWFLRSSFKGSTNSPPPSPSRTNRVPDKRKP